MSPMGEPVAMETLSPMAVDVEMESPRSQSEDLLTPQEAGMIDARRYRSCTHNVYTWVSKLSTTNA